MNELKNFKEKKLAEDNELALRVYFGNKYPNVECWKWEWYIKTFLEWNKQFISDLIDEMEKSLPKNKSDKYTIQEFLTNLNS